MSAKDQSLSFCFGMASVLTIAVATALSAVCLPFLSMGYDIGLGVLSGAAVASIKPEGHTPKLPAMLMGGAAANAIILAAAFALKAALAEDDSTLVERIDAVAESSTSSEYSVDSPKNCSVAYRPSCDVSGR